MPPLSTSGPSPESQVQLWAAGATRGGLGASKSFFSAQDEGEVRRWLGWGLVGQALAPRYLGLLLRVDPQLHRLQVVAGHEPLLQRKQQTLVLRKLCPLLPGSHAPQPPPGLLPTCPLNMTVAQLSLPFFRTKTMFPGMTWSSSGVSGTNPNSTR